MEQIEKEKLKAETETKEAAERESKRLHQEAQESKAKEQDTASRVAEYPVSSSGIKEASTAAKSADAHPIVGDAGTEIRFVSVSVELLNKALTHIAEHTLFNEPVPEFYHELKELLK